MKIVADENIDLPIVEHLRKNDHSIWSVYEMNRGITDKEVLDIANNEKAILLTIDKDFGELVFRQKMISTGVILIRMEGLPNKQKAEIVTAAINNHQEELYGSFTVITSESIRIRKIQV